MAMSIVFLVFALGLGLQISLFALDGPEHAGAGFSPPHDRDA